MRDAAALLSSLRNADFAERERIKIEFNKIDLGG